MNFIMKFLEKRFANEENVKNGFDSVKVDMQNLMTRLQEHVDITERYFEHLGKRITALEEKFELNESIPSDKKIVNADIKYTESYQNLNDKDKQILHDRIIKITKEQIKNNPKAKGTQEWTTTNAIIDVLTKQQGKKLNYSSIYALVKDYNLINPNVKIHSLKSTLYGLARQNRISLCNETETETGTFFIKTK